MSLYPPPMNSMNRWFLDSYLFTRHSVQRVRSVHAVHAVQEATR